MRKRTGNELRAGIVMSLAVAAITGPATSFAGPGCMSAKQSMARGFYPPGPMGPQGGYGPPSPYAYRAAPPAYPGMMAAPYQRPMQAQWANPGDVPRAEKSAPLEKSPAQAGSGADTSGGTPAGEIVTVRIDGMRFEPASITVKPGTTVTWVQASPMPHTISGTSGELSSDALRSGQEYRHTFTKAGRYDYVCDFHPSMGGSVIVSTDGEAS